MDDAAVLNLPNDPILLKRIIAERDRVIDQHESSLYVCDLRIDELNEQAGAARLERDASIAARQAEIEQIRREAAAALAASEAASQAEIAQRDAEIARRDAAIEQIKQEAAAQLEAERQRHKAELAAVLRRFYGPHSERFDPAQLLLFGLIVAQTPVDPAAAAAVEAESGEKPKASRRINPHKHGRRQLPAHLPRIVIPHDLTEEQKNCPCCGEARICIGQEISEQLEFVSASFKVLQHVRGKYACKACGEACEQCDCNPQIEVAVKEAQPIEKGLPGPGLLAHVIVSKLGDHLPLYRLEKIFDRVGVDIARSTMCGWMLSCGDLVKPLTDLMGRCVKQGRSMNTDDTTVPVQDGTVKGKCKTGRIWDYIGDEDNPYIYYEYTPDRTKIGPHTFLQNYKGYLQADAYAGYDGVFTDGNVIEVGCMAHARRKFFDAKETDGRRSAQMLGMVQELYAVEGEAKEKIAELQKQRAALVVTTPATPSIGSTGSASSGQTPPAIPAPSGVSREERERILLELRQQKSVPILDRIKAWLDDSGSSGTVLPRSPMAAAIGYMLNQWVALCVYATRGFLSIDNNAAERGLKPIAIGRKNWLFAGNDDAARSHARLYTLIASAERHGLNPQEYLMSVLAKIGQTPMSELQQFLPDVWKRDRETEKAQAQTARLSGAALPESPPRTS